MTGRLTIARHISESDFQATVADLATFSGWRHMHVRRSTQRDNRWTTATSIPGWPDIFAWRTRQTLAVELKTETGRLTTQQADVLDSLRAAGIDARVWRPSDWDEIEATLTAPPPPACDCPCHSASE